MRASLHHTAAFSLGATLLASTAFATPQPTLATRIPTVIESKAPPSWPPPRPPPACSSQSPCPCATCPLSTR